MTAISDTPVRFAFGDNWRHFLGGLDDARIAEAEASLRRLIGCERLDGLRFLDIGSGSGLFSLAARRLGAKVRSFDFDPASVECARILREQRFPNDPDWTVERGSVLDPDYLRALGQFDIVYSWGVLHHTGAMIAAVGNASTLVAPVGCSPSRSIGARGFAARGRSRSAGTPTRRRRRNARRAPFSARS